MNKPPEIELPDPLSGAGRTEWEARIRPALRDAYASTMYGPAPSAARVVPAIRRRSPSPVGSCAARLEIVLAVEAARLRRDVAVALYMPQLDSGRRPKLFFGPNYAGNVSVDPDPGIELDATWMRPEPAWGVVANRATDATRGVHAGRWPLAAILARGYAVATWHDGAFCPDDPERCRPVLDAGFGGAIAAWAWGFSRVLDGLAALDLVDATHAAAIGHSRHGKAALWAGACDDRLAITIANNSGTGGAKVFRHASGETIADLFARFPHWFAGSLLDYSGREAELPFDQHLLIGLCAPRAVYVASAAGDTWADPAGERMGAEAAEPIYALYGCRGAVGYHVRPGGHDVTAHDWAHWLDFADRLFAQP